MALSLEVHLPKAYIAQFPNRCVVCGCETPNSHTRIRAGSIGGWWNWLFWWLGKPFFVTAPACSLCGWKLHGLRLLSLVVTIGIEIVAIWWIYLPFEAAVPRPLRKWIAIAIVILCLLPLWIVESLFPKPFGVTIYPESVAYEFSSPTYATAFGELNSNAESGDEDDSDEAEPNSVE